MSKQWTIENDTGAELTVRAPNGFAVELDANSADPRERFAYFAIRQQSRDIESLRAELAAAVAERDEARQLAELERAAKEPVAWMWNDELGIPHASAGSKKPIWLESSASAEYIKQANLRPLYTAPPPAPVAPGMFTAEEAKQMWRDGYLSGDRTECSYRNADALWPNSGAARMIRTARHERPPRE